MPKVVGSFLLCGICLLLAGCPQRSQQHVPGIPPIRAVELNDPSQPEISDHPIVLSGAGNETVDFVVEVEHGEMNPGRAIRIRPPVGLDAKIYQILSVATDLNRAEFIRETGRVGGNRQVPRVLLPLEMHDGQIEFSSLRDQSSAPILIWVELKIPAAAVAGDYQMQCELIDRIASQPIGALAVTLHVNRFSLPVEPQLHLAGQLDWSALQRLYPGEFAGVMPRLLNRHDPQYAAAVRILDEFIHLGQENGVVVVVPAISPTVKWPPGALPMVDWSDFDSMVEPWLNGKSPLAYWPLPTPDFLENFDLVSRAQYWKQAADHFEKKGWLARAPLVLANESSGAANDAQSILLCAEARSALAAHPKLRVQIPLPENQVDSIFGAAIKSRLVPLKNSEGISNETHWMKIADQSVSTEIDVRSLGWRAFLDEVSIISCGDCLISTADSDRAVDSGAMAWFYPGQDFGSDKPLPTIQLKWLRRAQQDFEYLQLARQHGQFQPASQIAQLLTKPMQLAPDQKDDITLDLLRGTPDLRIWSEALKLLASSIIAPATSSTRSIANELHDLSWLEPQQRATMLARVVKWSWDTNSQNSGSWLVASIGLDIYNPSEETSINNQLQWTKMAAGWLAQPQPVDVAPLPSFHVSRLNSQARFNLDHLSSASRDPLELKFINGFNGVLVPCRFAIPVAMCERREKPLVINGSLDEWAPSDAINFDKPLLRMLDRPSLHPQQLKTADAPASIFTGWSEENLYIAFRLGGVTASDLRSVHNFVDYQSGRAWGEDLCEILMRPVYVDNTMGPSIHIVCKPSGPWIERKFTDRWQPFEAAGVRYASSVDPASQIWRGEIAIPWKAINAGNHGRPSLLRFNFSQHQNATGEDASWAGPIDSGRDDAMMGLIHLRER